MSALTTFVVVIGIIFLWLLTYSIMQRREKKERKKLLENYDETKDLSKLGEEQGRELRRQEGIDINGKKLDFGKPSASRNDGTVRRQKVPIPTPSVAGKNSNSRRKPSNNSKGIFGKLLRQRKQ